MTRSDILRLSGEAQVDPQSVTRFLAGVRVRPATARVVTDAAARLGIELPPRATVEAPAAEVSTAA